MSEKLMSYLAAGSVGAILGIVGFTGIGGPRTYEVRIIRQEGKPALMRIYRPGMDDILVQDPENKGRFNVSLHQHLGTIKDRADRELEEARIKKAVGWYE